MSFPAAQTASLRSELAGGKDTCSLALGPYPPEETYLWVALRATRQVDTLRKNIPLAAQTASLRSELADGKVKQGLV